MHDGDIDYSAYTLRQLEEALSGINRDKYPKNYANLCAAHQLLTATLPPTALPAQSSIEPQETEEVWPGPEYDESGRYIPNQIPPRTRSGYIILSLVLLAYGTYGVLVNDLYIPGKRRGVHLHDAPAWIMYGAMVCSCLVMLALVIDHYDRRDNERHYRAFTAVGTFLGWSCFGISLIWDFLIKP